MYCTMFSQGRQHPELYGEEISLNHCLFRVLKEHLADGGKGWQMELCRLSKKLSLV